MKQLIIIGAGGYGRELFGVACESVGYGTEYEVKGYLDGNAAALDGFKDYPPVIGSPESYVPEADDVFISAIGNLASRRRCVEAIAGRGGKFISLVHRSASLGPNAVVGEGSFVAQYAVVSADARVGRHSAVFQSSVIGHDVEVGDFSHVYSLCSIGGATRIGSGVSVYPGSVVMPRRTIGDGAVVGAGSTVILNVRRGESVFGSPARPVSGACALTGRGNGDDKENG